jgi:hypothetical protein
MYKYIASDKILKDMYSPRIRGTNWWNKEYIKRNEILKKFSLPADYTLNLLLLTHYPKTCFYSNKKLKFVPVNGYNFPSEMFIESEYNV